MQKPKKPELNGKGAHKQVTRVELSSGVTLLVTPLSLFARDLIIKRSEELYPFPDPKPYEKETNSRAGVTVPATENAEYKRLMRDVQSRRNNWQREQIVKISCDSEDRDELIVFYESERKAIAKIAPLTGDEWDDTLLFCILANDDDLALVMQGAQNALSLEAEEIVGHVRYFRNKVRGDAAGNGDAEQVTPSVAGVE